MKKDAPKKTSFFPNIVLLNKECVRQNCGFASFSLTAFSTNCDNRVSSMSIAQLLKYCAAGLSHAKTSKIDWEVRC